MEKEEHSHRRLRFGVFEMDFRTGELRKHGMQVRLQKQPFQVLAMLLEHAGEVVTREELQQNLWSADTFVDFDHGLNKTINKIREALGDSAESPRFVETVSRRGYRFLAEVKDVGEGSSPVSTPGTEVLFWRAGIRPGENYSPVRNAQATCTVLDLEKIWRGSSGGVGHFWQHGHFI